MPCNGNDRVTTLHKIPDALLAAAVLPPLDTSLPAVPAGFVGDVLPRVPPAGAFAAAVAPPRVEGVLPLPLVAAPPRSDK